MGFWSQTVYFHQRDFKKYLEGEFGLFGEDKNVSKKHNITSVETKPFVYKKLFI